jgi:hypothetical protein
MLDDEYELANRYEELEAKLAFVSGLIKSVPACCCCYFYCCYFYCCCCCCFFFFLLTHQTLTGVVLPCRSLSCSCLARHCLSMKRDRVIERLEWMIVIILSLEAGISFLKWISNTPH